MKMIQIRLCRIVPCLTRTILVLTTLGLITKQVTSQMNEDELPNDEKDDYNTGRMINIPTELIQDYFVENNGRDRYLCIIDTVPDDILHLLNHCKERHFPNISNAEITKAMEPNDENTMKMIEKWGKCLVRNFPSDRVRESLKYPMDCML